MKEKGINVHNETLPMRVGPRNHRSFFKEGFITLTNNELAAIDDFAKRVLEVVTLAG